ncbi:MAG: hypothetical protein ACYC6L_04715 [Anaerolineae bacterium]
MSWNVRLLERGFSDYLRAEGQWQLIPERYSWHSIGGPQDADIALEGRDERAVWEALELLRCPVEIYNEYQVCVWWGYVHEVSVSVGAITMGVNLDGLANKVAVSYETDAGEQATTAWSQDADSVALYGTKELLLSAKVVGVTAAEALRSVYLGGAKTPMAQFEAATSDQVGARAKLHCKGWWQTLDWKYYAAATGTASDTTAQIAAIVTAAGQFMTGSIVRATSGITCDPYRSGENTAKAEIEALLGAGNSSGIGLLAWVNHLRELEVNAEPSAAAQYYLQRDGSLSDIYGNEAVGSSCPVGVWAELQNIVPGNVDNAVVATPTRFFIEEASYEVTIGRYTPKPRGQHSDFGVGTRIQEG